MSKNTNQPIAKATIDVKKKLTKTQKIIITGFSVIAVIVIIGLAIIIRGKNPPKDNNGGTVAAPVLPTLTVNTSNGTIKVNDLPTGAIIIQASYSTFNLFVIGTDVKISSGTGSSVGSFDAATNTIRITNSAIKTALTDNTVTVTYTPLAGGPNVVITK